MPQHTNQSSALCKLMKFDNPPIEGQCIDQDRYNRYKVLFNYLTRNTDYSVAVLSIKRWKVGTLNSMGKAWKHSFQPHWIIQTITWHGYDMLFEEWSVHYFLHKTKFTFRDIISHKTSITSWPAMWSRTESWATARTTSLKTMTLTLSSCRQRSCWMTCDHWRMSWRNRTYSDPWHPTQRCLTPRTQRSCCDAGSDWDR